MSGHVEACESSKDLCDKLYECLLRRIPNLRRIEGENYCALYQNNRKKFAYIRHRKKMFRIQIWPLGNPHELQKYTTLTIRPRKSLTPGWAESFTCSFFVDDVSEIDEACEPLYKVSFRATS